ncbi:hypothetical protein E3N88_00805 [Mikania micrantha]|uniref:Aminotransferase-like plant mobile domain-containing protein n=1 Tax=Mikania micrantha TaxID=192012 RepID=A0A5N6PZ66_9ASTR|nr:hypothetical protein E3N88_00805 [Mikania micrantha]
MDAHFTSGPLNNDLLWLSGSHRGDYYFQNPDRDDGILRIRRGDQDLWKHLKSHPIPENVMEFITLAGFGGIVQCGNRRLDRALISALVERWRPETHTFHLPIGETTITLQDVNILWGLPIEGNVVSGVELNLNNSQITALFENLVGEELPLEAVNGYKINLPFILTKIKTDLPENPTRLQSIQQARLIIFFLIGATLFPDSASNWVHINYLSHLEDLNNCGELSWGSAVLACLYKHLCKVTDISRTDISGPVFLLQLWAWERFTGFAPEAVNAIDFQKPYGARYVLNNTL